VVETGNVRLHDESFNIHWDIARLKSKLDQKPTVIKIYLCKKSAYVYKYKATVAIQHLFL
jgi:hypothetical protein